MTVRTFTVSCIEHGEMECEPVSHDWTCTGDGCTRWVSAAEVFQQVTGRPGDASNLVALVVT